MNSNVCVNKATEAEIYRNVIVDIIRKIKPEYLKRIYSLVINVNNLIKATTIYSVCHSKIYIIFSSAQDFSVSSL